MQARNNFLIKLFLAQTSNGVKKITILIIALFLLVLAGGLAFYQYFVMKTNVQDSSKSAKVEIPAEQKNIFDADPQSVNVEIMPKEINSGGALTVCSDKCGDGICQKTDPSCKNKDLNCTCPETAQECPQDCK